MRTFFFIVTPQAGFEPATDRLTADCSTTELLRNVAAFFTPALINIAYKCGDRTTFFEYFFKKYKKYFLYFLKASLSNTFGYRQILEC